VLQAQDDWGARCRFEISKKKSQSYSKLRRGIPSAQNFAGPIVFRTAWILATNPTKFLKGGISYNLLNYYDLQDGWDYRHRYNVYVTGDKSFGRFNVSLRERLQGTHRPQQISDHNPKWYLRSRLEVEYDIKDCHFEPFASAEMYYSLNDPDPTNNSINRWRFIAGTKYNINKKNALQLYYRYTNYADEDDDSGHMICIGYSFDL
jgi:opacity protein-like surface antigen